MDPVSFTLWMNFMFNTIKMAFKNDAFKNFSVELGTDTFNVNVIAVLTITCETKVKITFWKATDTDFHVSIGDENNTFVTPFAPRDFKSYNDDFMFNDKDQTKVQNLIIHVIDRMHSAQNETHTKDTSIAYGLFDV
jgi:hypothetical protein